MNTATVLMVIMMYAPNGSVQTTTTTTTTKAACETTKIVLEKKYNDWLHGKRVNVTCVEVK